MSKLSEINGTVIRQPLDMEYYTNIAKAELANVFRHTGDTYISSASPLAHAEISGGVQAAKDLLASLGGIPQDTSANYTGSPNGPRTKGSIELG